MTSQWTARTQIRGATAATGFCLAIAATGCSAGSTSASSATSHPPVTPSVDLTSTRAKTEVIGAYRKMWDAQVQVYSSSTLDDPDLETYAHDKALAKIKSTAFYYEQHNAVFKGEPMLSPKVTAINLARQPHTAAITDCVDSTHWTEVDKSTGRPVPLLDSGRRHLVTAKAQILGGRWVITDMVVARDHPC